jgi:FkbM family methyltransferase
MMRGSLDRIEVPPGAIVKAAGGGRQTFSGDSTGTVAMNGNPYDYTYSEVEPEGGGPALYVLTATNGTGEYRFEQTLGRITFIGGAFCLLRNLASVIPGAGVAPSWGALGPPFVSHAQIGEDILLMRALKSVQDGFYIDVGAYDPDADSVTKTFYERGWRGINIEPSPPLFARLQAARPRDVNVMAACSSNPGRMTFYVNDGEQLGTLEARFAHSHGTSTEREVEVVSLQQVCAEHADADIHFLKVDVEGHEREVLEGMDFARFRPWIILVESVAPNRAYIPTFGEWEDLIVGADYLHVASDELNRYYVARERADLAVAFALPIDNYVRARDAQEIARLRAHVAALETAAASISANPAPRPSILRRLARRARSMAT